MKPTAQISHNTVAGMLDDTRAILEMFNLIDEHVVNITVRQAYMDEKFIHEWMRVHTTVHISWPVFKQLFGPQQKPKSEFKFSVVHYTHDVHPDFAFTAVQHITEYVEPLEETEETENDEEI